MANKQVLDELYEMGQLPADTDSRSDDFPFDRFDELLRQITKPLTEEDAVRLINLSPPLDAGCYGVEWTLMHLVETVGVEKLANVLSNSNENEVKKMIQMRLDNYNKDNSPE